MIRMPSGPGFGGMPNLPNLPNGMQPNPELMQKIMSSPEIMRAMQNPGRVGG